MHVDEWVKRAPEMVAKHEYDKGPKHVKSRVDEILAIVALARIVQSRNGTKSADSPTLTSSS